MQLKATLLLALATLTLTLASPTPDALDVEARGVDIPPPPTLASKCCTECSGPTQECQDGYSCVGSHRFHPFSPAFRNHLSVADLHL